MAKSHRRHQHFTGRVLFCWCLCVTVCTDTLSLFYKLGPSERMLIVNKVQRLILTMGFLFFPVVYEASEGLW